MTQRSRPPILTPDEIRAGLRTALGSPARPWGLTTSPRKVGERKLPGYRLDEYEYENGHGERIPLSVAEPDNRVHREPILAMHQTNECGRREVFGLDGEATLAYGHELARRGFRVFSFDMAWTGERARRHWDKDAFYREHPCWTMVGKTVSEMHDLAGLIRGEFGETESLRCIGHSLGGLMIIFHMALHDGVSRAVCNACYLNTPANTDPRLAQLYTSRVLNPDISSFCVASHFDEVIGAAGTSGPLLLIYYRNDRIYEHPVPSQESIDCMRSYGNGLRILGLAGAHGFPMRIRSASLDFLEGRDRDISVADTSIPYPCTELFGHVPRPRQVQIHNDALDMLPRDVRTVLDVGCGDGTLINRMPSDVSVVGVDISPEPLRYVDKRRLVANAASLPFADGQFDLIMANNVLEHLDLPSRETALREIRRVSNRYVLLTVPQNEELQARHVRCHDCGMVYHARWHTNTFCVETMQKVFAPSLATKEVRYTGDETRPPHDPCIELQHQLGLYRTRRGAICPSCGSGRQSSESANAPLQRLMTVYRCRSWYRDLSRLNLQNNRSDVMVLYGPPNQATACTPQSLPETSGDLLMLDFSNRLQSVNAFWPGAHWSRYMVPEGTWLTDDGIRCERNVSSPLVLEVRFPVVPEAGDRIIADVSSHGPNGRLAVYTIDGILAHRGLLANVDVNGLRQQLEWTVQQPWWPDQFGAGLAILLGPDIEIHQLRYVPFERKNAEVPFVQLAAGQNVVRTVRDGVALSWAKNAGTGGRVPKPLLGEPQPVPEQIETCTIAIDLLRIAAEAHRHFENDRINIAGMLEEKERARHNAEQAYAAAERGVRWLNIRVDMLREIAAHRRNQSREFRRRWEAAASELSAVSGIRGAVRNTFRAVKRKFIGERPGDPLQVMTTAWKPLTRVEPINGATHRVLVLSHMFPHPDQPSSGPFIHEQVKALREHGAVDARVVVGRPFWMTHRSPIKAWRANQTYWRYHRRCLQWWEYDGVPVAYLPYRIFGPYFTQGWAYQTGVEAALPWIQQEFDFDIIHAHTAFLDGAAGLGVSRMTGRPLVITEHTGPFSMLMRNPLVKRSTLRAMRAAKRVIVVSRAQGNAVSKELGPADSRHVIVVPNVVDTETFCPPMEWTPDAAAPRIVFVGYFVPIKQLPLLLDAFAIIRKTVPGATLRLVGGGENREQETELRLEIRQRDLDNAVIVQGHQSREKIARIMRDECDVLVLCSQSETFGCVLTEAMASGKPIVATRCGGPEDIVLNDRVGRLCENGNPDALAHAILDVVSNIRNYNAHEIRATAESHFGHSSVVNRLCDVYKGVRT